MSSKKSYFVFFGCALFFAILLSPGYAGKTLGGKPHMLAAAGKRLWRGSVFTRAKFKSVLSVTNRTSPGSAKAPARGDSSHDDALLDPYVEEASEFSSRARANVYFPNPQSIFNGIQFHFVNVGSGNLTFLRRDMVEAGRIPVVLARVYDSSSKGTNDFGPGWRLSATETISPGAARVHLTTESGSVIDFVRDSENSFRLERDYPSDYLGLLRIAPDVLEARLSTGLVKTYTFIRGEFRLTRVTDRNGNTLSLTYQAGLLAGLQNASHRITLARDKEGRIITARDEQGRKVSYAYGDSGLLVEANDLGGSPWRYAYDAQWRLSNATDPLQRSNFAVSYESSGRVAALQLPSGAIRYEYDDGTRSATVTDRRQLTSRFFQNEEGITVKAVNSLQEETLITLDDARNVTSLVRDGMLAESMQYDSQHRLVSRQSITDSGTLNSTYLYDPVSGLLTAIQRSDGASQTFAYDKHGNLIAANLSDGPHNLEFSSAGDLVRFSAQGRQLLFASDADGLLTSITDGQQKRATMKYNPGGQLVAANFPDGTRAEYKYQPSGLRTSLTYNDGRRVEYWYDPAGNLTSTKVFDAKGKQVNGQKLEMNGSYQLTRWVLFDGTETTFRYDANENLTEIAKGDSITRFQYDGLDRLAAVDTPDGQRLTYDYKPGERSLIEQYEHASVPVADLRDTGFTFSDPYAAMDSRPLTASLGAVRFSESLGTFQLANSDGSEIVRPHERIEAALAKLHVYEAGMTQKALWSGFNAPFNNMFVPAEYFTINCCPECYFDGEQWYCPPCEPPPSPPPTVRLKLGGPGGTDITGTTQSVVAGQQIALYADYEPYLDQSVDGQEWSVAGPIVGGFVHASSSGGPSPISLNGQSTTFYWVTAGNSRTVSFTVYLDNGIDSFTSSASATFNVSAPTPVVPTVANYFLLTVDTLTGCEVNPGGQFLVYGNLSGAAPGCGNPDGTPGISFVPPNTQSPPGTFFFVQIINSDSTTYSRTGATLSCVGVAGLDGQYPYENRTGQTVNDAPEAPLPPTYTLVSRSFTATMYVMWQSGTADSVPVPMGSVAWQFSGSASQPQQYGTWGSPTGSGNSGSFVAASGASSYPTWTGLAVTSDQNCH